MLESMRGLQRTDMCGELSRDDCGKKVTLMGWVNKRRDHGGLIFVDLRDCAGIAQVVFNPEIAKEAFQKAEKIRSEYVIAVIGDVGLRPEGTVNPEIPTGEIEVYASELRVLNQSQTPPFYIEENVDVEESVRLRYRYLDLRRPDMQRLLKLRHRTIKLIRDFLDREGFLEVETPILTRSTPEGARDYLVPSRLHRGEFFALPQSPQLFKQILMVSGIDKYFQLARCFRDEDLRADRQPEFTQLDLEMSFVERDRLMELIENLVASIFYETLGVQLKVPFPRLSYQEAINSYGTDRPDLRFEMHLKDVSTLVAGCQFKVFNKVVQTGGCVKGIKVEGCGNYSRKELDELTGLATELGAKGLVWMVVTPEEVRSPVAKFFNEQEMRSILECMGAGEGDLLLFVAGDQENVNHVLANLRLEMGRKLNLLDSGKHVFTWVVDFPLLKYNHDEERYTSVHHPFTAPLEEELPLLEENPLLVRAQAYDLVLNGIELGGGSIRIHRRDVQEKIFELLGMSHEEVEEKFGFLIRAFEYGAPPHGGIALGLDRLIMLLGGRDSIRDVIPFPKTQNASCLMTGAPAEVSALQLREIHFKTEAKK